MSQCPDPDGCGGRRQESTYPCTFPAQPPPADREVIPEALSATLRGIHVGVGVAHLAHSNFNGLEVITTLSVVMIPSKVRMEGCG